MEIAELHQLYLSCNAACTDTRTIKNNDMFFALKGDNFNGNEYANQALKKGAKYALIDEAKYKTTNQTILVKNVLETLQQLATYHRIYLNIPIIALTGSNGKTTTKELITTVLSRQYTTTATKGNLNNHIGVPLTLLSMTTKTEIGVVEMGANHLNEITTLCQIARPNYGYITNFGKAHLEGFGSIEGVIKGKSELYNYLKQNNNTVFVNTSDTIQTEKTKDMSVYTFANTDGVANVTIKFINANPFVKCSYNGLLIQSQLIGNYNFNNISAAIAIGSYFKINDQLIKAAIENYVPSNNRSQIIEKGNNKIILDAYNANPTSMAAALKSLESQKGYKIAILGDMFELGTESNKEHQNITNLALSLNIDKIILVGSNFFKTQLHSNIATKYKSFAEFKSDFNISEINKAIVLIKGSRGMALERILDNF